MPRERDLVSLLQEGVTNTPEKPVYSFLDKHLDCVETLTFASLFDEAVALACHLQRCGLNRTPVLLIQQKHSDFVKSFWACLLAGAWPMPCARPRGHKWQQLALMAQQSGAAAILTSSVIARLIPGEALHDVPVIAADQYAVAADAGSVQERLARWVRPSICAEDIAFIQYTSGSTSRPKGVVITHGNVMSNLASISRAFACTQRDTGLSWLPLHHDMGLIGHVLQPVYAGIQNFFMSPVDFLADPSRWVRAIAKYAVTISGGPAFAYGLCAHSHKSADPNPDLSRWRLAYCGSDRIVAETLSQFDTRFRTSGFSRQAWFPCYGLAESTLYVCGIAGVQLSVADKPEAAHVCIGDLASAEPTTDVRIVDPQTGQLCADCVVGEIWISSASVSPGYYRQSILSRQCFNQSAGGAALFFRTGDLGFMQDRKLYFSGRLKNVIKVRGRSLHAEDIESLLQHETADTGLQRCVAVRMDNGHTDSLVILAERRSRHVQISEANSKLIERQIRNLVCDTFGVLPQAIIVVPPASLPLTSSGKPARAMCQQICSALVQKDNNAQPLAVASAASARQEVASNV